MSMLVEIPVSLTIVILYPVFWFKFATEYTGYNQINRRDSARREDLDRAEYKIHGCLFVVGLLSIFASTGTLNRPLSVGIGVGGVVSLVTAIFYRWEKYTEIEQLLISGVSLATIIIFTLLSFN